MIVKGGNYSWTAQSVEGAVEIRDGNFEGTNFVPVGEATLWLRNGNFRAVKFDSVSPPGLEDVPDWVEVGPGAHLAYGWTKPSTPTTLPLAVKMFLAFQDKHIGKKIWFKIVEIILIGPADLSAAAFVTSFNDLGYPIDAGRLRTFMCSELSIADNWTAFRAKIREHDIHTWRCKKTQNG